MDVSVIIKLRKLAKDAALAAFAASKPGRIASPQDAQIEALQADNARLSEALKELAVELTLCGESALGLAAGPVPARVDGNVKEADQRVRSAHHPPPRGHAGVDQTKRRGTSRVE